MEYREQQQKLRKPSPMGFHLKLAFMEQWNFLTRDGKKARGDTKERNSPATEEH
jgi:hypothetical protein